MVGTVFWLHCIGAASPKRYEMRYGPGKLQIAAREPAAAGSLCDNARVLPAWRRLLQSTEFRLFMLVWLVYGLHVVPGGGANPNRYFDLTHSLVNHGTLNIDLYHENTHDKAYVNGHYYSSGWPGPSLAAVPAYLSFKVLYGLMPPAVLQPLSSLQSHRQGVAAGFYQRDNLHFFLSSIWLTWFCLAPLSALGTAALYRLLRRTRAAHRHALAVALLYAWGTPVFHYSTTFFSHVFTATITLTALCVIAGFEPTPGKWQMAGLGALTGSALLMESQGAVLLALFGLYSLWRWGPRALAWQVLGAAPLAAVLLAYNTLAFGSPWTLPYAYLVGENFTRFHSTGFMGMAAPRLGRLLSLTFGAERGLFLYAPILLLAHIGWLNALRGPRRETRDVALLAAAGTAAILVWISAFEAWFPPSSFGPRYLVAAIPLLAFGVAHALPRVPTALIVVLAALSLLQNWMGAQYGAADHALSHWPTLLASGPTLPAIRAVLAHSSPEGAVLRLVTGLGGLVVAGYAALLLAAAGAALAIFRRSGDLAPA
jgi:hypothetical protein